MNATADLRPWRRGFTVIEMLTVLTVVCMLLALLLPAVQQAREAARKLRCRSNLMQIGVALRNYESAHGGLPPGVVDPHPPVLNVVKGYHFGWIVQILPHLEQSNTYNNFDFSVSVYDQRNKAAQSALIEVLHCPSRGGMAGNLAFAACHHDVESPIDVDNRGVMYANSHIRRDDIEDGAANTIFVGEGTDMGMLGWAPGNRSTLRNTGTRIGAFKARPSGTAPVVVPRHPPDWVGGYGSSHGGGAHFLFGDGAVRFVSDTISMPVYQRLGNRADGELTEYPY